MPSDALGPKGLPQRFWDKVDVCGPDECWPWKANRSPNGYGMFSLGGRKQSAHRLASGLRTGDPGHVLHRCDNPPCCNPAHLYVGSAQDNVDDMYRRGRAVDVAGEAHAMAKLTLCAVKEIRARYAAGGITQRELGDEFGISHQQVSRIVRGTRWAHAGHTPEAVGDG